MTEEIDIRELGEFRLGLIERIEWLDARVKEFDDKAKRITNTISEQVRYERLKEVMRLRSHELEYLLWAFDGRFKL